MIPDIAAGGGFAIAGYLIKVLADLLLRQNRTITNHISHSTEVMTELVELLRAQKKES